MMYAQYLNNAYETRTEEKERASTEAFQTSCGAVTTPKAESDRPLADARREFCKRPQGRETRLEYTFCIRGDWMVVLGRSGRIIDMARFVLLIGSD